MHGDDDGNLTGKTYELWRANEHEREARTAATSDLAPDRCRIRKCRRDHGCTGPMVPSAYQAFAIEAQRMLDFSGNAVACLPLCLAESDETTVRRCMAQFPLLRLQLKSVKLPRYDKRLRGRPWR